ncbi:hypothetical protein EB118_19440 [bacterium]|nr:hypothetical protein [bacterium]NDD82664.1 hypothetical protein [bacterium]NDG32237.1 hypothetical protein [bacterium]
MEAKFHNYIQVSIDKVKELSFNRNKSEKHVKTLSRSVSKIGVLRTPVIAKTKAVTGMTEYYIIDGQHLIESLKRLSVSKVNAIVVETDSVAEIVDMMGLLNNVQQRWTLMNYVDAYIGMGLHDYFVLKQHSKTNGFSINLSAGILSGCKTWGRGTDSVKQGTFKVSSTDVEELTNNLQELSAITGVNTAKFQSAYVDFFRSHSKTYNHTKFMKKVECNLSLFQNLPHDTQYCYSLFVKLYK